jgi:hypothetical protein
VHQAAVMSGPHSYPAPGRPEVVSPTGLLVMYAYDVPAGLIPHPSSEFGCDHTRSTVTPSVSSIWLNLVLCGWKQKVRPTAHHTTHDSKLVNEGLPIEVSQIFDCVRGGTKPAVNAEDLCATTGGRCRRSVIYCVGAASMWRRVRLLSR